MARFSPPPSGRSLRSVRATAHCQPEWPIVAGRSRPPGCWACCDLFCPTAFGRMCRGSRRGYNGANSRSPGGCGVWMSPEYHTLLAKLKELDAERAKAIRAKESAERKSLELQEQCDAIRTALALVGVEAPGFDAESATRLSGGTRGRKRAAGSVTSLVRKVLAKIDANEPFTASDIEHAIKKSPELGNKEVGANAVRKALSRLSSEPGSGLKVHNPGRGQSPASYIRSIEDGSQPRAERVMDDEISSVLSRWPPENRATT